MTEKKKKRVADLLHFSWTCPLCHWKGEVVTETHFGNDRGRNLHIGDCLFDCDKQVEPRHLYFLELFTCPGCATEDEPFFFVAEIHCIGNRWVALQTYAACDLVPAEPRV